MKLKNKDSAVCPYCLTSFTASEVLFRCSALPQICQPEIDEVFDTFFDGPAEKRGRVFKPESREQKKLSFGIRKGEEVGCDMCATPTQVRICPQCHGNLPADFFTLKHIPFGFHSSDRALTDQFSLALMEKMKKITGHDIKSTIETGPLLNGFIFSFDRGGFSRTRVLVSFHHARDIHDREVRQNLRAIQILVDAATLFGDEKRELTYEAVQSLHDSAIKGAVIGMNFYNIDQYFGYFARASIVVDSPDFSNGYQNTCGEFVSQEILTLFGASYGVNFLRQIRENLKPWRFGVCSLKESQTVPLSAYHRIEDLFLWQLFLTLDQ